MQLKLAIAAALLTIGFDVWVLFSLKPQLRTGWLFFAAISMFRYMLYIFFLGLAYNGRSWVKYLFVVGTVLSAYSLSRRGYTAFSDPIVIGYFCSAALTTVFWFSDASQAWYRNPVLVAT